MIRQIRKAFPKESIKRDYENPSTLAKFDLVRQYLIKQGEDGSLTNGELGRVTYELRMKQYEVLGIESGRPRKYTQIPSRLFHDYSDGGALCHILQTCYSFKRSQNWKDFQFSNSSLKEKHLELIGLILKTLQEKNFLKFPTVFFSSEIPAPKQEELKEIVIQHSGTVTTDQSQATHIVEPNPNESEEDLDYLRTLERKDNLCLVHWWYYPNSYENWIPSSDVQGDETEPDGKHEGVWRVTTRWISDMDLFNEWMNEIDYEIPEKEEEVKSEEAMEVEKSTIAVQGEDKSATESSDREVLPKKKDEGDDLYVLTEEESQSDQSFAGKSSKISEDEEIDILDTDEERPVTRQKRKEVERPELPAKRTRSAKEEVEVIEKGKAPTTPMVYSLPPRAKSTRVIPPPTTPTPTPPRTPQSSHTSRSPFTPSFQQSNSYRRFFPQKETHPRVSPRGVRETTNPNAKFTNISQSAPPSLPPLPPTVTIVNSTLGTPQTLFVPKRAQWFSMNDIHDIEKRSLPEFFDGASPSKTPEMYSSSFTSKISYREYRDFMINAFQQNPTQYLTQTACRRNLAGDVCAILRMHSFLEHWGLINFNLTPDLHGPIPTLETSGVEAAPSKKELLVELEEPKIPPADLRLRKNIFFTEVPPPHEKFTCWKCEKDCSQVRYHHNQVDVCPDCFAEGALPENTQHSDFVKHTGASYKSPQEWTEHETLLLLEALERFGEDWNSVAEHVGTKNKEQCILQFLRLPIEDPYLEDGVNLSLKKDFVAVPPRESFPFSTMDNPIMSMVTFLASVVSPAVAGAAAQAALEAFLKQRKEEHHRLAGAKKDEGGEKETEGVEMKQEKESEQSPMETDKAEEKKKEPSGISRENVEVAAAAALASATLKAKSLAEREEKEITTLLKKAIDLELKKIELKMKHFDEMEKMMDKERVQIEKARQQLLAEQIQFNSSKFAQSRVAANQGRPSIPGGKQT